MTQADFDAIITNGTQTNGGNGSGINSGSGFGGGGKEGVRISKNIKVEPHSGSTFFI
jgi:hypothetical protein